MVVTEEVQKLQRQLIQLIQLILQASEALAAHGVAAAARRAVAFEHELGQLTREGGQPRETDRVLYVDFDHFSQLPVHAPSIHNQSITNYSNEPCLMLLLCGDM